jgi:hypothetical protein
MLLPVALVLAWAVGCHRVRPASTCSAVKPNESRLIWPIATTLVVVPPLFAVLLGVYFASDWGFLQVRVESPSSGCPKRAAET